MNIYFAFGTLAFACTILKMHWWSINFWSFSKDTSLNCTMLWLTKGTRLWPNYVCEFPNIVERISICNSFNAKNMKTKYIPKIAHPSFIVKPSPLLSLATSLIICLLLKSKLNHSFLQCLNRILNRGAS